MTKLKRYGILLLALALTAGLLAGCSRQEAGYQLQEQYSRVRQAQMAAEVVWHGGEDGRSFEITCTYDKEAGSTTTVSQPEALAGLSATMSGEDLTLSYEGAALPAGSLQDVSVANCLPLLLEAAAEGYVREASQETMDGAQCLRLALETTGPDGQEVLCTGWFYASDLTPCYAEFSQDGQLLVTARLLEFDCELEETEIQ